MPHGLTGLLRPLQNLLSVFQRERHFATKLERHHETDRQEALNAILEALINTRRYINGLPDNYDRDEEYKLSELWAVAAIRSRKSIESIQPELLDKAEYWLSDIRWPREMVVEKSIDLQTMENKFRKLVEQS